MDHTLVSIETESKANLVDHLDVPVVEHVHEALAHKMLSVQGG